MLNERLQQLARTHGVKVGLLLIAASLLYPAIAPITGCDPHVYTLTCNAWIFAGFLLGVYFALMYLRTYRK